MERDLEPPWRRESRRPGRSEQPTLPGPDADSGHQLTTRPVPATGRASSPCHHERAVVCDPEAPAKRMRRCHEDPDSMCMPVGSPSSHEKKSPLTPATVAVLETRRCIEVTVSRPSMKPFERTDGAREPARPRSTEDVNHHGPWDVKRTWRSYVIRGVSMTRPAAEADGAKASTKMPAMRALRSTTAAHGSGTKDEAAPVLHVRTWSCSVQTLPLHLPPRRWASDLRGGR